MVTRYFYKNPHTYSNRTYLFSIRCFIKNTSEVKNNTSVSECCDEVSLLACSVAAACYLVSLQINILLQFQHVSFFHQSNLFKCCCQFLSNQLRHLSHLFSQKFLSKAIWFKYRSDYALQIANVKTFNVMG